MPIDSSKFFDSIRIKPRAKQQAMPRETVVACEKIGCQNKGIYRAPKGRENPGKYWHFCLVHVREYNQNYNFFSGMNAEAIARYQKDALTGHLPTWKIGAIGGVKKVAEAEIDGPFDPSSMLSERDGPANYDSDSQSKAETRKVMNAERKALQIMGLDHNATLGDLKTKYRALVKQHHPDANGGDRSTEDRLIEIIKAYNYLKTVLRDL
ncbi:J domain-containing protein [Bradyrhizobium sp. NC92]|uniref:J domain-containing protein n=1 Tax=Bradyrhizobium sp. (strain NC92) TaxID=55395 RepID=UPI0021AAC787|nr:DnaJ domain-containing protein [Bradyrhizobium sp. NC92]UWU72848.1 DnaJ domain-containing protein [Bradyrhizobium sp. NC92]